MHGRETPSRTQASPADRWHDAPGDSDCEFDGEIGDLEGESRVVAGGKHGLWSVRAIPRLSIISGGQSGSDICLALHTVLCNR